MAEKNKQETNKQSKTRRKSIFRIEVSDDKRLRVTLDLPLRLVLKILGVLVVGYPVLEQVVKLLHG